MHLRYPFLGFSRATSILSPHLKHRRLRVLLLRQAHRHAPKNFVCRYFITVSSYTKDLLLSTSFRIFQEMVNLLCKLRRIFHFMHNFLFLFYIDLRSNYAIMNPSRLERVFPKQDAATAGLAGQGHTDSRVECRRPLLCGLATSVALLIELKAQFYKLVTINRSCPMA